jgi:FdrA protein
MAKLNDFFGKKVSVINLGIPSFAEDLKQQNIDVVHVEWRPPAGGNKKIQALLEKVYRWQSKLQKEAK